MSILRTLTGIAFACALGAQERLPNTAALTLEGDLAARMVDGINTYLIRETDAAVERRARFWKPDYSSPNRTNSRSLRIGSVSGASSAQQTHGRPSHL